MHQEFEHLAIPTDRRRFLKNVTVGAAGLSLGAMTITGCAARKVSGPTIASAAETLRQKTLPETSTVSFVVSTDQRAASYQALKPIAADVMRGIGTKRVVIKVNSGQVTKDVWLNATDPNFVRGILDFLKEQGYDKQVIIAESTAASTTTMEGFTNYGYLPLEKEYNVKLIDLNDDTFTTKWILNQQNHPQAINILDTFLDPNVYMISATRFKTHNNVVVTLAHKNIAMASPANHYKQASRINRNEKQVMHQGGSNRGLSYNLFMLGLLGVQADLAVLDGVVAMDGNGPVNGVELKQGVALASTDWVAADRIGTELMGVDYTTYIRYIQWCASAGMGNDKLEKITVLGPDYKQHIVKYKLHPQVQQQYQWVRDDYKVG